MSLLEKLKAVLSGGSDRDGRSESTVQSATTTTPPDTDTESAVKEPVDQTPSNGPSGDPPADESSGVDTVDETPATVATVDEDDSDSGGETDPVATDDGSDAPVAEISGIGPAYSDRLESIGVETVGQLAAAEPDEIASQTDISIGRVSNWIERARDV